MKNILFTFSFLWIWISSSAQDSTIAPVSQPIQKLDTILATAPKPDSIIKPKYDIRRAEINERIDGYQLKADRFDDIEDGKVYVDFDRSISPVVSYVLLQMVDSIQYMVEESDILSHREKQRYLTNLSNTVQSWYSDALDGYFVFKRYQDRIENMYYLYKNLDKASLLDFLKRHADASMSNIACFSERRAAFDFLKYYANYKPNQILDQSKEYNKEMYFDTLLVELCKVAPSTVTRYLVSNDPIARSIKNSQDPYMIRLVDMFNHLGMGSQAYVLFDDIYNNRLTYYDADSIARNKYALYRNLIKIRATQNPYGNYSIDDKLNELSLTFVREINALYEMHDSPTRFASAQKFNAQEIYTMIVYTEDEIFTSTFNGLYKLLLTKMKPMNGRELLYSVNDNKMRVFIKMCAGYNVLNTFLTTMDVYSKDELLYQFVQNLEKPSTAIEDAVHVADTFGSIRDPKLSNIFYTHVETQFDKMIEEGNQTGIEIYGILRDLYCNKGGKFDVQCMTDFITKYRLRPMTTMSYKDLMDQDSVINIQFFFFDDEDGEGSYANFLGTYRSIPNWTVYDRGTWVMIENMKGQRVRLFANKPKVDQQGQAEIAEYFNTQKSNPSIVVHRGHSFYTATTISQIPFNTKIVILGGCGGYHTLTDIIDKSPQAQIVSTKQTGTMRVNDPMLREISTTVNAKKDIIWENIWNSLDKQFKDTGENYERFKDYVPPHKNLGAIFLMAYNNKASD